MKVAWEVFDSHVREQLKRNEILDDVAKALTSEPKEVYTSKYGKLYQNDCLDLMSHFEDEKFDLIFADPPFNLNKLYPSKMNDNIAEHKYIEWMEDWLVECVRLLKDGGSLFIYNLPKWNSKVVNFLERHLTFRNWIAISMKYSLPIPGRLYPSHYSLIYFCKGEKPRAFHPDRIPMDICPKCYGDLKDYGGYKSKMNPAGVNISDVWTDIPPVRHAKYKRRNGSNELSIKLLDRIIEMSSNPGDTVFDPFGGSGSTYIVSELKQRLWIGCEIGPPEEIVQRFSIIDSEKVFLEKHRDNLNTLFTDKVRKERLKRGLWTDETIDKPSKQATFDL